ncbi:hypothetical protein ElyMa_005444300 [Elysia marginata]|uniref:Uncharacterized protein n=1 Tax=Elysia marginata TaxID=1093978 RepID=A0AAV4EMM8_9GAST|nr:hypothetical protein ElyMa_005444300 [Elysia marginata]
MKSVCEGRLDGRRRKGRPPISLLTNLTTACGLSLHQIVQKSQDRAGWQQKVRSSIAMANTASGDADRYSNLRPLALILNAGARQEKERIHAQETKGSAFLDHSFRVIGAKHFRKSSEKVIA